MATPRHIRRFAFQLLFQIDAMGGADNPGALVADTDSAKELTPGERDKAAKMALGAYADRAVADAVMVELAPTWPAHRQAAVDRAILRLAHFEMTAGSINPKIVVNEAVELAKEFSTEKSPAFVNGLLDKVLKRVLAQSPAAVPDPPDESSPGPSS
ncbi:MAG: transcription antitermination factor NusB [Phycisphaerales bacterium]